jgi:hypothetical protein
LVYFWIFRWWCCCFWVVLVGFSSFPIINFSSFYHHLYFISIGTVSINVGNAFIYVQSKNYEIIDLGFLHSSPIDFLLRSHCYHYYWYDWNVIESLGNNCRINLWFGGSFCGWFLMVTFGIFDFFWRGIDCWVWFIVDFWTI